MLELENEIPQCQVRRRKPAYGAGQEGAGIPEVPRLVNDQEKGQLLSAFQAFVSPSSWGFSTVQETLSASKS